MADLVHFEQLSQSFADLLRDLSPTWPEKDLQYIRDEVDHREYADALENLIVIGLRNNGRFAPAELQKVKAIATSIGLQYESLLLELTGRTVR